MQDFLPKYQTNENQFCCRVQEAVQPVKRPRDLNGLDPEEPANGPK